MSDNKFDLDPGVEYLCFKQFYPDQDYRVMRITRSTRLCYIIDMFDKIDASPIEILFEQNKQLLNSNDLIAVINLSNNKYNIMSIDAFKLCYELLPPTYEKFHPRMHAGEKVKVFNPSGLETADIVVIEHGLDLPNILAITIEDVPTNFKRIARVLSNEDIYRQFNQGKTIGVSYNRDSGELTYYREDMMSRFYLIKEQGE